MGPHSTHGYNCIVVGFILTTNELLCLTLYEECFGESLTLKYWKCTKEKNLPSSRIDPGTNGPLGGCWNDGAPQHPRFYLYIVVGFILTTNDLLCLALYEECIAWCVGVRNPMVGIFTNHWKVAKAWHWNVESALRRKISSHQGLIPGPMALWEGAGMMGPTERWGPTAPTVILLHCCWLYTHY